MDHQTIGEDVLRVALHGRLDSAAIDRIETSFRQLLAGQGRHTLIDLRDVGFAASMAIRMFVASARLLQQRGRRMVLYGAQPLVGEVFAHVALDELIPIVAGEAEALQLAVA